MAALGSYKGRVIRPPDRSTGSSRLPVGCSLVCSMSAALRAVTAPDCGKIDECDGCTEMRRHTVLAGTSAAFGEPWSAMGGRGASGHGSAPWLSIWTEFRPDFKTMPPWDAESPTLSPRVHRVASDSQWTVAQRSQGNRDNAAMTRLISPLRRVAGISGQVEHTCGTRDCP
jgi:hypothetical protein